MIEHTGVLCYILATAGPLFFMSMQVSYLQTAMNIYHNKSDLQLSPLPFVSLLTNCAVMSLYGLLKSMNTVLIPNFTGLISGIICTVLFQMYTKETKKEIFILSVLILTLTAYFAYLNLIHNIGLLGVLLSIILMGSPLATLGTVIKEKSTNSLPFLTSVTTFLNALSWALYGMVEANDPIIYIPNLIGLFLACIQLSLFVIYGFPVKNSVDVIKSAEYESISKVDVLELGDNNIKKSLLKNNQNKNISQNYI